MVAVTPDRGTAVSGNEGPREESREGERREEGSPIFISNRGQHDLSFGGELSRFLEGPPPSLAQICERPSFPASGSPHPLLTKGVSVHCDPDENASGALLY
jgi:hypothetical protein